MKNKVWLITGASKGFGRIWAEAALKRGDKVAATARNTDALAALKEQYGENILPIKLNVDNREDCLRAVEEAQERFGRIDILINNAGFGHFGFIEEISEPEARAQMETNFFGSLWMIQAVLPFMKQQKTGHIIQVSSIGGVLAFPSLGVYHASKWAVEGLCESLSQEVAMFNINVSLVEPTGYNTDWGTVSATRSNAMADYQPIRDAMAANYGKVESGNPNNTADAISLLVDSETPPLRMFLGKMPYMMIEPAYNKRLEEWKSWQTISESAQ